MIQHPRRQFLRDLGLLIGAASPLAALGDSLLGVAQAAGARREVARDHYRQLGDGNVQCLVCPLNCTLRPGDRCFCRTRLNESGQLVTAAYANPCLLSIDPIEKLPLAHFLPEEKTLSVAFGGCNLRCLYCQNWSQSQEEPENLHTFDLPPDRALTGAEAKSIRTLAYTYTEPVASYEYCLDLATAARERGVRNVVATALYINPEPLRRWCAVTDAFAVSLKGFDEAFYRRVLGSSLSPVLTALEVIRAEGVWLELVTLVVPTLNDDPRTVREMCRWIARTLGSAVPLHFGRFVPQYRLRGLPRTAVTTLERCRDIALEAGLQHVYIFNLSPHEGNNTVCPSCRREVIVRLGLRVVKNEAAGGKCGHCGTALPGVWA